MRRVWPEDECVADFFDSPSFGVLWLGPETDMIMDLSRVQAAFILGMTVDQLKSLELGQAMRAFFPDAFIVDTSSS